MSTFFRGALNLLQGDTGSSGQSHPLVGQDVDVGGLRLRIKSLIAEGGFAVVLCAQDGNGRQFALKRQIANDREAVQAVLNEINVLKELIGRPHILRFHEAAQAKLQSGGQEFLIVTELCTGGSTVDLLKSGSLSPTQVLRIFYGTCMALKQMHVRERPITHRDIKVENILFDSLGHVKLCDFGSSTREVFHPDHSWSAQRRTHLIEEMQRNTTPMYRAPEIQDEYMNLPVGPQQDIWALGCVLFYLCYHVHPFEDSAKLRIVNAKYQIPIADQEFRMFIPLIQSCLQINPMDRPTIADLCDRVEALSAAMDIDCTAAVPGLIVSNAPSPAPRSSSPMVGGASRQPGQSRNEVSDVSQQATAMFGAIKGQGLSLFKNIKDRSAAVVQTVQSTYGGRGPDVSWITYRLLLAPQADGIPEALAAQAEDSLRSFASEQGRPYLVANISQRRLKCEFSAAPLEFLQSSPACGPPPCTDDLFKVCAAITQFLRQNPNGFIIFYGLLQHCVLFSVSVILYNKLLPRPMNAFELINDRRSHSALLLPPSFHRILDTFSLVINAQPNSIKQIAHRRPLRLSLLRLSPPPHFNRAFTGCRPFVEVFNNKKKLWTTFLSYEQTRMYESATDPFIEIAFNGLAVDEDVTLVLHHARWSKMHNRMQQVFMLSLGFNANFLNPSTKSLTFHSGDIDGNPDETAGSVAPSFRAVIELNVDVKDRGFDNLVAEPPAFLSYNSDSVSPRNIVENSAEFDRIKANYELGTGSGSAPPRPRPPQTQIQQAPPKEKPPAPNTDFFSTLQWGENGPPSTSTSDVPISSKFNSSTIQNEPEIDLLSGLSSSDVNVQNVQSSSQAQSHDTAEAYERMYGIRVNKEEEDDDADKYKFDYEKTSSKNETPILGAPSPVQSSTSLANDFDLLGLDGSATSKPAPVADPFGDLFGIGSSAPAPAPKPAEDLFGDWSSSSSAATPSNQPMHRNVSAPAFAQTSSGKLDPFAEFMASQPHSTSNPGSKNGSGSNSRTSTPKPTRPNYSRSAFETVNSGSGGPGKPKVTADAFGDLLSSQGFTSSAASGPKTLGDMRRAEEIRDMDPIQVQVRDWSKGKEKNIRALLGSLNDVLWEGASRWQQPSMGDLLTADQVKKSYRKALLVVHPDKLTGTPEEELARAICNQLIDAWNAFEQAGSPSL